MTDYLPRLTAALSKHYTIERELGRGGMATVYLAQDLKHRRRVALKVLRPELTVAVGPDRFLREIEIASQFVHPHILPVFDSGEAEGFLYYVMPYVSGESLRGRLAREGQLPVDEAVEIACDVANALGYAHSQGFIHRDIKPENILFEEGHAVVADFGIARAISAAVSTDEHLTGVGLALGTPLYMSPEQAAGHSRLDGRSDIYSLGCVLYEMLAGEPPFRGPSPQAVTAQHAQDSPPVLREKRPGVPAQIEQVVTRCLHKLPADRFATAAEFASALPHHATPTTVVVPALAKKHSFSIPHISRVGWALIAVGTLAAAVAGTAFERRPAPVLDQSLYMVLPFRHRAQSAPMLLNGDQCESLLHDALGRWRGVQMVDPLWVADARSRRGASASIEDGLSIARERRAGRVVMGEVWEFKDTIHVRGLLYDASGRRVVREHSVRIAPDLNDAQLRFRELADSLLVGGAPEPTALPRRSGQFSLPAWRAFQEGYSALHRWDLDSAKAGLKRAITLDPTYGAAQLWLAQAMAWSGDDPGSWRRLAVGALASRDSMSRRDQALAEGLMALAENRFPEGCESFQAILARDSLDFAAWFGLGECQGKDPVVLKDASSPSGWRFRGSYHSAISSYRRALEIVPSVHLAFKGEAFSRLPDLLYTESNHIRRGYALVGGDTVRMGAFPSLSADTLGFVPHPMLDVVSGKRGAVPTTVQAAVSRNRAAMKDVSVGWVVAYPNRSAAHETLALVLETLGELAGVEPKEYSALGEIRRARETNDEGSTELRLAAHETRLLLKAGQMEAARGLADSILRANQSPTLEGAEQLRGIAALTGRLHLAARLQRQAAPGYTFLASDWEEIEVPIELADPALALLAYASFGAPLDSIVALERTIERLLPSYVERRARRGTLDALLGFPAVLAFPERGLMPVHRAHAGGFYLLEMQWALARGDTAQVRRAFAELQEVRGEQRPGEVSFEGTYHEARLHLMMGDTSAAIQTLDLSLNALPTLGTYLLDQLPQVATLVRGMALRAELAAHAGDLPLARQYARHVLVLWSDADPELHPILTRMRAISG